MGHTPFGSVWRIITRLPVIVVILTVSVLPGCVPRGGEAAGTEQTAERAADHPGSSGTRRTINLLANDHPWIHHIAEHLSDFTRETGIIVNVEVYPEEQFRAKRTVEMLSGISEFDLFMIMPGNSLSEYHHRGWVEPLERFMTGADGGGSERDGAGADTSRAEHNSLVLERDDFFPAALAAGVRDGKLYSVPILLETSILAYNRELFDRYDLSVPRTMTELETTAKLAYERSDRQIYGITMRGRGASATSQWSDFLHSFGGTWFDDDGNAAIHSPESIAALETYGRLLRLYGPRDATGNGWYESLSLFIRGEAAMIFDANVFRTHYEDDVQSSIADHVGYAMLPAGPAGSVPHISHWGLAISSGSRRQDAAWRFIVWAAAPDRAIRAHRAGIPSALESVWDSPEASRDADTVEATEWVAASTGSYAIATHLWNPPVIQVEDARAVVGEAIVAAILDQDVHDAAKNASRGLDRLQVIE
jgi:multiple sugar transport system substrate-binding protein